MGKYNAASRATVVWSLQKVHFQIFNHRQLQMQAKWISYEIIKSAISAGIPLDMPSNSRQSNMISSLVFRKFIWISHI